MSERTFKIALLGDSMTAFWGTQMPELRDALERQFPDQPFELLNYGVSGTRAEYGIHRVTHDYPDPFEAGNRKCLSSASPDLVIVESFAYNHRTDGKHQVENYKRVIQRLWEVIGETTPASILFLVTIPPDKENFLDHVPTHKDVLLDLRKEWAEGSDLYLNAAIELANEVQMPLINVYQCVTEQVEAGTPIQWFIDQNDHIHPSRYAYELTAEEIVKAIQKHQLLSNHQECI